MPLTIGTAAVPDGSSAINTMLGRHAVQAQLHCGAGSEDSQARTLKNLQGFALLWFPSVFFMLNHPLLNLFMADKTRLRSLLKEALKTSRPALAS